MESLKEMKEKMLELPIEQITISQWDVRRGKEDQQKFDSLVRSIEMDGILHPLTVISNGDGKYILVAGRRRLKACKQLGMKKVPVFIKNSFAEESEEKKIEIRKITLIENLHRRELNDVERCYGILALYQSAGYTPQEAIGGVKSIDNYFSNNKGATWKSLTEVTSVKIHKDVNPLRHDKKFIAICQSVGYTPKFQYQLLQLTRDIPQKVLEKADKLGLSTDKKIALTHTSLRKHPKLQNSLVNDLAKKQSTALAREKVYQTARDLETGAIEKVGKTYMQYDSFRDKLSKKTEKLPTQSPLKITAAVKKLLFELTDIQIPKTKVRYNEDLLPNSKGFMTSVVKAANNSELVSIEENLDVARKCIEQMLGLVNAEFNSRDSKQEMLKK